MVVAILAIGAIATLLLFRSEDGAVRREERESVERVTRALAAASDELVTGFAAGSSIVDADGTVDREQFVLLARELTLSTVADVVAHVAVVDDADRADVEATLGGPLREIGPEGVLVDAARRPTYTVVVAVQPETEGSLAVLGFDIASDPARNAAVERARDTGEVTFSAPITAQPDRTVAFFIVRPLYLPGAAVDTQDQRRAAVVGYLATPAPASSLLAALEEQLPADARAAVTDGDAILATTDPAPEGGAVNTIQLGGRTLTVHLDVRDGDHGTAILMAIGTFVVAALVGLFLWRIRRHTKELQESAMTVRELGRLSEQLAVADTIDDALRIVSALAAASVGADLATLAVPSAREDSLLVVPAPGGTMHPPGVPSEQPAGSNAIMVRSWQVGETLLLTDLGEVRRRFPSQANGFAAAGLQACAAIPLCRPDGSSLGVLAWAWRRRERFRGRVRATLDATAEICQQALTRADLQQTRRTAAAAISALGQGLSVARDINRVADEVVRRGPAASGADHVAIGILDEVGARMLLVRADGTPANRPIHLDLPADMGGGMLARLRLGERIVLDSPEEIAAIPPLAELVPPGFEQFVALPLLDSAGHLRGVLGFIYIAPLPTHRRADLIRLLGIAGLTAQTVERAHLYQQQSDLVVELQRRSLPSLPVVDGVRVAARYVPASSALGLGGDWYDVQLLDGDRTSLVVGDVVGHGIDAIADMTQFRTTVSTLLRTCDDLAEVAARSTALLSRPSTEELRFATAVLMVIDPVAGELTWHRAGHPPPMVRGPDGAVSVLEGGAGTPIGIVGNGAAIGRTAIGPGSVVVAYTDGLIERRTEAFDDGLRRLLDAVAAGDPDDLEGWADEVMALCLAGRETTDDAALVLLAIN